MTLHSFISKWQNVQLKERSASQADFIDLCQLLRVEDPVTADPKSDWYAFEKGASKTSGSEGWADVWREGCFAWEYKDKRKDLTSKPPCEQHHLPSSIPFFSAVRSGTINRTQHEQAMTGNLQ